MYRTAVDEQKDARYRSSRLETTCVTCIEVPPEFHQLSTWLGHVMLEVFLALLDSSETSRMWWSCTGRNQVVVHRNG